jgi:hypothetical protein
MTMFCPSDLAMLGAITLAIVSPVPIGWKAGHCGSRRALTQLNNDDHPIFRKANDIGIHRLLTVDIPAPHLPAQRRPEAATVRVKTT